MINKGNDKITKWKVYHLFVPSVPVGMNPWLMFHPLLRNFRNFSPKIRLSWWPAALQVNLYRDISFMHSRLGNILIMFLTWTLLLKYSSICPVGKVRLKQQTGWVFHKFSYVCMMHLPTIKCEFLLSFKTLCIILQGKKNCLQREPFLWFLSL